MIKKTGGTQKICKLSDIALEEETLNNFYMIKIKSNHKNKRNGKSKKRILLNKRRKVFTRPKKMIKNKTKTKTTGGTKK